MAGWSILADGFDLDCFEILRNLQMSGYCLSVDASAKVCFDGGNDMLRSLFDRIVSVFLEEVSVSVDVRPLPATLGDGRCVDLFNLFCIVRKMGGYDTVSRNGLWGLVAEESGLDSEVTSSVKLIHFKYLDLLDRWSRKVFAGKGTRGGLSGHGRNSDLLSDEYQEEFRGLLSEMSEQMNKHEEYPRLDSEKNDLCTCKMNGVGYLQELNGGVKIFDDTGEFDILDNEGVCSLKRRRECISGMLNWVMEIARHPREHIIGMSVEEPKWKALGEKEFWEQAILTRQALFLRRQFNSNAEQYLLPKKQKTHTLLHEDHMGYNQQCKERIGISQRFSPHKNSHTISCSNSLSAVQNDLYKSLTPCMAAEENHPEKWLLESADYFAENSVLDPLGDSHIQKQVSLGPLFQADVPEWTGVASESDSKWLGTQIWPLETGEFDSDIERDPIGKGRHESCGCHFPGSVECVRFHIAEKRMAMKRELGLAFYHWRFNHMGEEVSLPWSEEEEKKFKAIVRSNPPSLGKCFWLELFKYFHSKSRESLVRYYFNVFLIQRRSYQNRVTPNNVDSDDDESEFGSVSSSFGYSAIKSPGSDSVFCAQNKQCIYLD